jgi:hypothetical protein
MSMATVNLFIHSDSGRVTIHPLRSTGIPYASYSAVKLDGMNVFRFKFDQSDYYTPWLWIEESSLPASVSDGALVQSGLEVFPNPVSGSASISVSLKNYSKVRIAVYDNLGRESLLVAAGELSLGKHTIPFNCSELTPGHYTIVMQSTDGIVTAPLIVIK